MPNFLATMFAWLSLANEAAESSQQILAATNEIVSTMKDAEASQRGYVLTGRREFLKPYEAALRDVRPQIARLHALVAHRPEMGARVDTLNGQVEDRIREMERLIAWRGLLRPPQPTQPGRLFIERAKLGSPATARQAGSSKDEKRQTCRLRDSRDAAERRTG